MFRLYVLMVLVCCSSVGGSFGIGSNKEACYGEDFTMSLNDLVGYRRNLFFTPAKGGSQRIQVLLENGTLLDPHYEISSSRFIIREVTERDDGEFSYTMHGGLEFKALRLKIKDCSSKVTWDYGSDYDFRISSTAYSLEFTPLKSTNPVVLWNRTSNHYVSKGGGGGRLVYNKWQMEKLTQEYNGYYTFRDRKHKFISRNKITVEERKDYFLDSVEGEELQIINFSPSMDPALFDLTFNPTDDPMNPTPERHSVLLMKAGNLLETSYDEWGVRDERSIFGRIWKIDEPPLRIMIADLQPSDSGHFKLIDQKGNLALVAQLRVEEWDPPYFMYVGFAVGIFLVVVFCCCCVKRCCCKTTRKKDFVRQPEAAPAAYSYDHTTQPSTSAPHPSSSYVPTYSAPLYPNQPKPGATYYQPLVPPGPENLHVSSSHSQPEVVASTASREPAATAFLGVDALSSDAGPRFELKGMMFATAPPLSSYNTSYSDVYTSDKLNFR